MLLGFLCAYFAFKGSPRYKPLARGMAAALPSIDVFLPGHNLESLEELRVLGGPGG